jgi:outer membrane protein insertion porin family
MRRTVIVVWSLLLIFSYVVSVLAEELLPNVTAIEIKGLRRIEEGAVRSRLSQKVGEQLSQEKTTADIKAIYRMGYFDDVKTELIPFEGGIKVVYIIKEKPTIVRVSFQGNKEYDDKELREKMPLSPGAISDITLINDNAIKLRQFYEQEGYYLAKVVPVVRKLNDEDVEVTYQIDEGKKVKIKDIIFVGNNNLSSRKIRKVMKTDTRKFYSFIIGGSGYYNKEDMQKDLTKIRELYYENGFIKVQVSEPKIELTPDKLGMIITIQIEEGDRYTLADIEITGNKTFETDELRPLIKSQIGKTFNGVTLKKDTEELTKKYTDNGFAVASVMPDLKPDDANRTVKVNFIIEEGEKYSIGRIEITGNSKTRDKVIRREIRVAEGDTFNGSALKRSFERLNNLNFFDKVEINPKPRQDERVVDLDVEVKEKDTGFLTVGSGYSSTDGIIGTVDITQTNLFGGGQYLKLKGDLGTRMSNMELGYRDPYFMDKNLLFGVTGYKSTREYQGEYKRRSVGIEFTLGKELAEYWGVTVGYNFDVTRIYDVNWFAMQEVKDEEGNWTTSALTFTITQDSRDNIKDPLRGSRNQYSVSFAGLGGNVGFLKHYVDSGWYFPIFEESTIHVRGRLGWLTGAFGKKVPIYQKFYVGGLDTIRGLNYGEAGPKDPITDEAIGAEKMLIGNLEYIFPIFDELKLKGIAFYDIGKGWANGETFGSGLRHTAGGGIRWFSPFGPIRIEYGFNLDRKPGESAGRVEFGSGTNF